jgi:signal transduction histidine kinase
MFRSTHLKLTAWYLAILMVISVGFSVALYTSAHRQIGFVVSQAPIAEDLSVDAVGPTPADFQQAVRRSENALKRDLLLLNMALLIVGGFASSFLARRHLRPIEEVMEEQGRFTADASHELRTPLTAMKTEIEVALREKKLSLDEARRLLESNLEEVDRLRELSDRLLALAQYENARGFTFAEFPFHESVREAVEKHQAHADEQGITLETEAREVTVEGDQVSLEELTSILVENSIKYGRSGGTVKVLLDQAGESARLEVKDDGMGIKASDLPHIFNRFYRADASRSKDRPHGYGLGLAIAQKIAERHHGTIEIQSTPGEGTTVSVLLPRKHPQPLFSSLSG